MIVSVTDGGWFVISELLAEAGGSPNLGKIPTTLRHRFAIQTQSYSRIEANPIDGAIYELPPAPVVPTRNSVGALVRLFTNA